MFQTNYMFKLEDIWPLILQIIKLSSKSERDFSQFHIRYDGKSGFGGTSEAAKGDVSFSFRHLCFIFTHQ